MSARTAGAGLRLLEPSNTTALNGPENDPWPALRQEAWLDGNLKVVKTNTKNKKAAAAGWALYDLGKDPGEKIDLSKERPDIFRKMVAQAEAVHRG